MSLGQTKVLFVVYLLSSFYIQQAVALGKAAAYQFSLTAKLIGRLNLFGVVSHRQKDKIHPQSLQDSPGGALGTVFPRPLASLRSDEFFT